MQQPDIDIFAQRFRQNRLITLNNILPEELATSLAQDFDRLDWMLQIKDYSQSNSLEIPISDVPNRDNLAGVLYDREHDLDLNNLFYIRLYADARKFNAKSLVEVSKFLNSDEYLEKCRQITGIGDIRQSWIEATCYDKSCFLGYHMDAHHPGNRVAFVLNLTRSWKLDWGGLLLLESTANTQPIIVRPIWNSLTLFQLPVGHTVTCVSQAATEHRYSITGWLRP